MFALNGMQIIYRSICFLGFLLSAHVCTAQFTDNFSDGNFTNDPSWGGSTADFTVNGSFQMQLNNVVASTSVLSSAYAALSLDNFEWQVYVKQTFSPSGSNYGRVYLASDQSNLAGSLNGYYLQFGEAGSSDAVELFRQTGTASVSVCRATNGSIASSANLRVRVLRNDAGLWQLFIDYAGGTNFVLEASGSDATFNASSYLGVLCVYTSSNANKFYYDDFYMGPEIVDTTPPAIASVNPVSATELHVVFNEKVDLVTAQSLNNYFVNNEIGNPSNAVLQTDNKTVRLTFAHSFPNAITCQLAVSGVEDLFNNTLSNATQSFLFFQPVPAAYKDIVITEIFPDPSPTVGLPEAEFLELHNRSDKTFDLQNWKISDGSSTGTLSSHLFFPGEYIILTSSSSASLYSSYGIVLGVSNFPTLNNAGETLVLKDNADAQIDNVTYSDGWYRDDDKKQGGYTLELIDPANPCGEDDNWIASEADNGGTPGTQNSVFANKPDVTGPELISAIPASGTELRISFNEKLDNELPDVADLVITPVIMVSEVMFDDASLKSIRLLLSEELQPGKLYSIEVHNIYDCSGNEINLEADKIEFGLPEEADSLDIVINEILFNPRSTGVDFVEVYNNSSKFINLKNWLIANYENSEIKNAEQVTDADLLLSPGQYIVFTEDADLLKSEYILAVEENLLETNLPGFSDDEGTVVLIDPQSNVIDFFAYADDYHSIFLNDDEGVSLERISFTAPTNDANNWKSASSTSGFATPGDVNSNVSTIQSTSKITVSPEIFEPITGQPAFTQIQYNFDQGGYVANVKILDFQGREIKQLVNNATLGTEGFFRWDGDTADGMKARTGYYIVWVEAFNTSGEVETFRKRVVVAAGE